MFRKIIASLDSSDKKDLLSLTGELQQVTYIIAHQWSEYFGTPCLEQGLCDDSAGCDSHCTAKESENHVNKSRHCQTVENNIENSLLLKTYLVEFCKMCQPAPVSIDEDDPQSHFESHKYQAAAEQLLICCDLILDQIQLTNNAHVGDYIPLCGLCSLICEYSEQTRWTSVRLVELGSSILHKIVQQSNSNSVSHLFTRTCSDMQCHSDSNKTILSSICEEFSKKFTKENWKNNIPIVYKYKFCVLSLKYPHVSEYVDKLLPAALLLIDDFEVQYRVIGVQCIAHLIQNCSKTELQWHGRAKVIYDALWHLTYNKETELVKVLYPCLFSTLELLERPPRESLGPKEYGLYDKCFSHLITNMELENNLELRRKYSYHLIEMLSLLGITAVRHLPRLLSVIQTYLDIYDGPAEKSRQHALQALAVIVVQLWPRIPIHTCTIFQMLVKFATDIHLENSLTPLDMKSNLMEKVREILLLLKKLSEPIIKKSVMALDGLELNSEVKIMLKEIIYS